MWGRKKTCSTFFSWLKHKVPKSRVILAPFQTSGAKIHGGLDKKSVCERHESTHKPVSETQKCRTGGRGRFTTPERK